MKKYQSPSRAGGITDAGDGEQSTKKLSPLYNGVVPANHSKDNGGISIWMIIV